MKLKPRPGCRQSPHRGQGRRFLLCTLSCLDPSLQPHFTRRGGTVLPVMMVGPTKFPSGYSGTDTFLVTSVDREKEVVCYQIHWNNWKSLIDPPADHRSSAPLLGPRQTGPESKSFPAPSVKKTSAASTCVSPLPVGRSPVRGRHQPRVPRWSSAWSRALPTERSWRWEEVFTSGN